MARTEAQKKAQARYNKQNVKRLVTSFYPADSELYEHVMKHENKAGYIKELIRKDLENGSKS